MVKYEPLKAYDLKKGTIGYVPFELTKRPVHGQNTMILCEIVDVRKNEIEIVPIAGDNMCIWIDSEGIYKKQYA